MPTENTKGSPCQGRLSETLNSQASIYQTPGLKSSQDHSNTPPLERALLGSSLEQPQLLGQLGQVERQDLRGCFWVPVHRQIYGAIADLYDEGIEPTPELVAERSGVRYEDVSGLMYQGAVHANFHANVRRVRELARERLFGQLHEELGQSAVADRPRILEQMQELRARGASDGGVRHFEDIPEIQTLDIPLADYIVPALGIARNTITLWTGEDGSGKTILAYSMSGAVAQGREFLGMACQQSPVLYIDLENPAYVVQSRVRAMLGESGVPQFRVWGIWNEQQPPQYGNPVLLNLCKETKPLLVVDPFRYFHEGDEDSSTAMAPVMKYLRTCAACGGAVVILHHPAKAENSKGRGSSAIRAGCDLAFMDTLDKDANLITLRVDKNRHGERRDFTLKADFEEGKFELSEAAWISHRKNELLFLQELIYKSPGISTNQLCDAMSGRRGRILNMLEEGSGTLWTREAGLRGSKVFYPIAGTGSRFPSKEGEPGNQSGIAPFSSGTNGNQRELGTSQVTQ
jgi:hypothetical protein